MGRIKKKDFVKFEKSCDFNSVIKKKTKGIKAEDINEDYEKKINKFNYKNFLINIFFKLLFISLIFISMIFIVLYEYGRGLSDYSFLQNYSFPSASVICFKDGTIANEFLQEKRTFVKFSDIPPELINAFISAEDKNFYKHYGIDILSLLKAIFINTLKNKWNINPIGASTITQQISKILLIGNEKSITRKIKEAILALRIEYFLSKDRILELYLNQIYLGESSYGISLAAKKYFNKSLSNLTLSECAMIASLPKSPVKKNPFKNPSLAKSRRDWVINRMHKNGFISKDEAELATKEKITLKKIDNKDLNDHNNFAGFFIEEMKRELIKIYGENLLYSGGIKCISSMEVGMQKIAEEALQYGLEKIDRERGWLGPIAKIHGIENYTHTKKKKIAKYLQNINYTNYHNSEKALVVKFDELTGDVLILTENGKHKILFEKDLNKYFVSIFSKKNINGHECKVLKIGDVIFVKKHREGAYKLFQRPDVTGAFLLMNARTGEILAMTGGYTKENICFNCATQAVRQVGSLFKPFVYLSAFEHGFSESSKINEKKTTFKFGKIYYTPKNFNKNYAGLITLRNALALSQNVATVILAKKVGLNSIVNLGYRFNLCSKIKKSLTLPLGTLETTPLKMLTAYSSFFNGGLKVFPQYFINFEKRIGERIISKKNADQISSILMEVVKTGTARKLNYLTLKFPIKIMAKTGSTNGFKDAWISGAFKLSKSNKNSEKISFINGDPISFIVFVGYTIPKSLGKNSSGGRAALPVVEYFIKHFCKKNLIH